MSSLTNNKDWAYLKKRFRFFFGGGGGGEDGGGWDWGWGFGWSWLAGWDKQQGGVMSDNDDWAN